MKHRIEAQKTQFTKSTGAGDAAENAPGQERPLESLLQELRQRNNQPRHLFAMDIGSAMEAIWANRTRSLLTILGIVIGIASVIAGITTGQGVGEYLDNSILSQGVTTIQVTTSHYTGGGGASANGSHQAQLLSTRDLQLLHSLSHVAAASPVLQANGQVIYGNKNWHPNSIEGVNTDFQAIQSWQVAQGLWFSQASQVAGRLEVVLGDTTAQHLFGTSGANIIGQQIQISGQSFRVVGVLAPKGGFNLDDVIFMPYTTAQARVLQGTTQGITNSFVEIDVNVDNKNNIDQVIQEITATLDVSHRIPAGSPADFQTLTAIQQIQEENQSVTVIGGALLGVAAISLIVAGISIMNIALVSITERTREIGIRISVGARRRDIRNQFLIEVLFQCLIGGIIGTIVGVSVGWLLIRVIISAAAGATVTGAIPFVIMPATIIVPFVVSISVGLIFGLYPAIRASQLDPIIALRRAK